MILLLFVSFCRKLFNGDHVCGMGWRGHAIYLPENFILKLSIVWCICSPTWPSFKWLTELSLFGQVEAFDCHSRHSVPGLKQAEDSEPRNLIYEAEDCWIIKEFETEIAANLNAAFSSTRCLHGLPTCQQFFNLFSCYSFLGNSSIWTEIVSLFNMCEFIEVLEQT